MNITDEPMPGVQQPGSRSLWAIARKGNDLSVLTTYLRDIDFAERWARSIVAEGSYDEVIILDGLMKYRAWNKDTALAA